MSIRSRAIWLPAAPAGNAFPSSHQASPNRPSPDFLRSGSFSRVCVSSTEYLCRSFRPSLARRHRAARVSALFATSPMVSTFAEAPASASFRPRVFATPRRLAPPFGLWAYCIPLPRAGFSPFRGFSRSAAVSGFHQCAAPMPLSPLRSPASRLPTQRRLGFEALLRVSIRSSGQAVKPFLWPFPSSVFPPPSGRRLPPRARFLGPSAHDVFDLGLSRRREAPGLALIFRLQRVIGERLGASVSGYTHLVEVCGLPERRTLR